MAAFLVFVIPLPAGSLLALIYWLIAEELDLLQRLRIRVGGQDVDRRNVDGERLAVLVLLDIFVMATV